MRLPMPRDLKEPAGWRFSSLRKMRLEGFGQSSEVRASKGRIHVPSGSFGESGRLDQRGRNPGFREVCGR